jgi:hypothetical protein
LWEKANAPLPDTIDFKFDKAKYSALSPEELKNAITDARDLKIELSVLNALNTELKKWHWEQKSTDHPFEIYLALRTFETLHPAKMSPVTRVLKKYNLPGDEIKSSSKGKKKSYSVKKHKEEKEEEESEHEEMETETKPEKPKKRPLAPREVKKKN